MSVEAQRREWGPQEAVVCGDWPPDVRGLAAAPEPDVYKPVHEEHAGANAAALAAENIVPVPTHGDMPAGPCTRSRRARYKRHDFDPLTSGLPLSSSKPAARGLGGATTLKTGL